MSKTKLSPSATIPQVFLGFVLFLLIVSASVTITLNFRPLYYADIYLLNLTETTGRTYDDIRANYDALIDYNSLFNNETLSFPSCDISETGRIHFEEVKVIFDIFGKTAIFTLILTIVAFLFIRRRGYYLWFKLAGILGIVVPIVLGLMVAINWEYVFITFHHLAFDNDYWLFDETTDPIITLLPDTFFMHCAIMIFALIFIASILCLIRAHHLHTSKK